MDSISGYNFRGQDLTSTGTNIEQLTLPAPAFVPSRFLEGLAGEKLDERVGTAQEFVQLIPEYQQIFGSSIQDGKRNEECLLAKMKIMITSVGGLCLQVKGMAWQVGAHIL